METVSGEGVATATEMRGHRRPSRDTGVPIPSFAVVARALWPKKTAAFLASIAGKDERMAKRWLRGEYPAPAIVITAIMVKITDPNL